MAAWKAGCWGAYRGEGMVAWRVVNLVFARAGYLGEKGAEKKVFVSVVCWAGLKVELKGQKWVA